MAIQIIDVGDRENDRRGDPIREAFIKINQNFAEIDGASGFTASDLVTDLTTNDETKPAAANTVFALKSAVDGILLGGGYPTVVDDLTTGGASDALSADQGVALKAITDGIASDFTALESDLTALDSRVDTLEIPRVVLNVASGTDITTPLANLFSIYSSGSRIFIPAGSYTANVGALSVPSKTWIEAAPGSATITGTAATATNGYGNAVFAIKPGASDITIDGVNFAGPDRWNAAVIARGASNVTLRNINTGNICLFWGQRTSREAYDAYASMSSSNWCTNVVIDNCHGTGGAAVGSGDQVNQQQFIELRYVNRFDVSNCTASSYASGVQWWGGNAANTSEAGSDYMSGERKCGEGTIRNCRMVSMGQAGIWGSMGRDITVSSCFVKNCSDIGLDPEGSYDIRFVNCTAEDCTNANMSTYYACKRISYIGCTSRSSSAASYPFLFKSWSVVGSANRNNNRDHHFTGCTFECEDGIGLLTNDAGGANFVRFSDNTFRNARVDMFYNGSGTVGSGTGGSGRLNIDGNTFEYTIGTTPAIQTGTATAGASSSLTDSGKAWKVNVWKNCRVSITSGTGSGQARMINSNTGTALTVSPAWSTAPDATSVYRIDIPAVVVGSNSSGDHYVERNKITATTGSYFWAGVVVRHEDGAVSKSHYVNDNTVQGGFTVAAHIEERTYSGSFRARVFFERNKVTEGLTWTQDSSQASGGVTAYIYSKDNAVIASTVSSIFSPGYGSPKGVLTPEMFGAVGDGSANDSVAILRLVSAINAAGGGVLELTGTYRFVTQQTAMTFTTSNVSIRGFGRGTLLMDNINGSNNGTGHGVLFRANARENISVDGVIVRWNGTPNRSTGEGFRFEGYPSDTVVTRNGIDFRTIKNITLTNCQVENAPQTGAIFMGCSDIQVSNFKAIGCKADQLHFNACRRWQLDGLEGVDSGDDTLAVVTYYHATEVFQYGSSSTSGPFTQPSLGEWSNSKGQARNIICKGKTAQGNGVRLAGAYEVLVDGVSVEGNGFTTAAVQSDGTVADGVSYMWTYLASRRCTVTNVKSNACVNGVLVQTFNPPAETDPTYDDFTKFDLTLDNIESYAPTTDYLFIGKARGVNVGYLKGRGMTTTSARGVRSSGGTQLRFEHIDVEGGAIYFDRDSADFTATNWFADYGADYKPSDLWIGKATIRNATTTTTGAVQFIRHHGVTVEDLEIISPARSAFYATLVSDAKFPSVRIFDPNASDTAGTFYCVYIPMCRRMEIDAEVKRGAQTNLTVFNSDGGSGSGLSARAHELTVRITDHNQKNQTTQDLAFQATNGPTISYLGFLTYNGGEASPVWRGCAFIPSLRKREARPIRLQDFASLTPGTVAANSSYTATVTVPGARVGDYVSQVAYRAALGGCLLSAEVTADNTVTVRISNPTGSGIAVTSAIVAVTVEFARGILPSTA